MKRIYKYSLEIEGEQYVNLPFGAKILDVLNQNENLVLYALVDDDRATLNRLVRIFGTGHPVNDVSNFEYAGTAAFADGALIWHVFINEE